MKLPMNSYEYQSLSYVLWDVIIDKGRIGEREKGKRKRGLRRKEGGGGERRGEDKAKKPAVDLAR